MVNLLTFYIDKRPYFLEKIIKNNGDISDIFITKSSVMNIVKKTL